MAKNGVTFHCFNGDAVPVVRIGAELLCLDPRLGHKGKALGRHDRRMRALAAIQQHVHIERHVRGRGGDAASGIVELKIGGRCEAARTRVGTVFEVRDPTVGRSRADFVSDNGRCSLHPKWIENARLEGSGPGASVECSDEIAQGVESHVAVVEALPRLPCLPVTRRRVRRNERYRVFGLGRT